MAEFDNTNTGLISKNKKKVEGSKQPDYLGILNVEGKEYAVSGWIRSAKSDGHKFLSLSVKPK